MSLIVNNYNYAQFLPRCLESLLAQENCESNEVIVVDDGSTDASREIIAHFSRFGVTPVLKANGGQASAFNAGFRRASGDVIWFIDSDDELVPHASKTVLDSWVPGIAFLQCGLRLIDEESRDIGAYPGIDELEEGDLWGRLLVRPKSRSFVHSPTSGLIFSRRALAQALPLPESSWRVNADGLLVMRASRFGHTRVIKRYLSKYRLHSSNAWAPVLFGAEGSSMSGKTRLMEHDANRRAALAPFVHLHQSCEWEEQQSRMLTLEAVELRKMASLSQVELARGEELLEWSKYVERRALGSMCWRTTPPPAAHFDIWQIAKDQVEYKTSSWPSNCPWAFGFDLSPWVKRQGFTQSTNRLSGIRLRPNRTNGGILHLLLMAADPDLDEIRVRIYVQGERVADVAFTDLHRVSVWLPPATEVTVDFVSTGQWSLIRYALSMAVESASYPNTDFDASRETDLTVPHEQIRVAMAATRQGLLTEFHPQGLVLLDPRSNDKRGSLALSQEVSIELPLSAASRQGKPRADHTSMLLSRIGAHTPGIEGDFRRTCVGVVKELTDRRPHGFLNERVESWDQLDARFPESPLAGLGQVHVTLPRRSTALWSSRPDLQQAFDLATNWGRLGYYSWLRHEQGRHGQVVKLANPSLHEVEMCAVMTVNRETLVGINPIEMRALMGEIGQYAPEDKVIPPHLALLWAVRSDLREFAPDPESGWWDRMRWWWLSHGAREHGLKATSIRMPLQFALSPLGRWLM